MVFVPKQAPQIVANASAMKAFLKPGIVPSGRIIPALVETPIMVPIVSNISMNRNVDTAIIISILNIFSHSNWNAIGSIEGGALIKPSNWVNPIGMPIIVVISIPSSMPPATFLMTKKAVTIMPMMESSPAPWVIVSQMVSFSVS